MELNSPLQRSKTPKAPDQPKVKFNSFMALAESDVCQELEPFELGDNEAEPTLQELQHRIFMQENKMRCLLTVLSYYGDARLQRFIKLEFDL